MPHPLDQRIDRLRSRVRRLVLVYGLCWTIGAVLGAVLLLGAADYVIRFDDRGIRVLSSLAVLGVLSAVVYRCLYSAWKADLSDVDLALRLERRFPALGDSLASAVEFLRQSEEDPLAGSVAMRRAVIARATADTEPLDFVDAVDRRPAVRAVMSAVVIVLVALILVALNPSASRIALVRLLNPLGSTVWPRTTHLVLRQQVDRVARGQDFDVEVTDADGRLPPDVLIHCRFADETGQVTEETERMHLLGGAMSARRENVVRPFSYRITGGDDDTMPWLDVAVVEPPRLDSLAITLVPPAYTGWPAEQANNPIRVLAGTRLKATGRATKPLRSVQLRFEGGPHIAGRIEDDGFAFTVPARPQEDLPVTKSGQFWIELTDDEGLSGGRDDRWEIRALPDTAPTVVVERPTGDVFVTPEAVVPLRIVAKDDLAVQSVALQFSRSDGAGQPETVLSLYTGPKQVPPQAAGLAGGGDLGESRLVEYAWQLGPLKLSPGMHVSFSATARDYHAQTGKSDARRLVVITPEEMLDRIAALQASILSELARVLAMQRQGRQQVADLEIKIRQTGQLQRLDMDHLRGAELNQRQVNNTLTSRTEGVPMQVLGLLADLENNKIDNADIRRRMDGLLAEIDRLAAEHLPDIGRELTNAIKAAQTQQEPSQTSPHPQAQQEQGTPPTSPLPQAGAGPEVRAPKTNQPASQNQPAPPTPNKETSIAIGALTAAGRHQDAVIASLEQLLGELSRWDSFRKFHRDLSQLLREQDELTRRTTDLGRHTLAKELKDLPPQDAADIKIVTRQQYELARRLDRTLQEMDQAVESLQQNDPLAAETVADASSRARQLATTGKMRTAAESVEQNQMGMASAKQYRVIEDLKELLDILSNRREQELEQIVDKLREAEKDLADLANRQEQLQKQAEQTANEPETAQTRQQWQRLAQRQAAMQQETERMSRRLERLTADQAGRAAQQAAQQMKQGTQAAQPQQHAAAAKKALDEAARQAAQRRRDAEAELAMEQLSQLDRAIKAICKGQERILDETRRLDDLQQKGPLDRSEALALAETLRQQTAMEAETRALADKLTGAPAIHLALQGAATEMARSAAMLDRRQTGLPTQQAQQHALDRLAMVTEALQPETPQPKQGNQAGQGGQGGQAGQGGARANALQALIELKLTKAMQTEINRRTRELQTKYGHAQQIPDEARKEYDQLSREQGELAALLLKAIQSQEKPQDGPGGEPAGQQEPVP